MKSKTIRYEVPGLPAIIYTTNGQVTMIQTEDRITFVFDGGKLFKKVNKLVNPSPLEKAIKRARGATGYYGDLAKGKKNKAVWTRRFIWFQLLEMGWTNREAGEAIGSFTPSTVIVALQKMSYADKYLQKNEIKMRKSFFKTKK